MMIAWCKLGLTFHHTHLPGSRSRRTLFEHFTTADHLRSRAAALRDQVNALFWLLKEDCFAIALEAKKSPITMVASNGGHALWAGIVDLPHQERLVNRLLQDDMMTRYDPRTLSSHNGSIWPHDNALIAYRLSRYGLREPVLKFLAFLFDASTFIDLHRTPELFCGFPRRPEVRIKNLQVGQASVDLLIWRYAQDVSSNIGRREGKVEILHVK
jgi:glycogen debranching enzyme